jgi:hypothetical protein
VAGSRSLAHRCGAGVETTGGGSVVRTSNMKHVNSYLCVIPGLGAAASGCGEGGAGNGGGVVGGEGTQGMSWAITTTPTTATGQGSTSSMDIGSQTRGEGTNMNGEALLDEASRTIMSQSHDEATEG